MSKHPLVIRGGIHRIATITNTLFDLNIEEMLASTASDRIHVWLSAAHKSDSQMESITIEDPQTASKLYNSGHSLYCRAPADLESEVVPRFLSELGFGFSAPHTDRFRRGEIETFYSRKGHITPFHTDFQENFTIVLSGKKLWSFRPSTAKYPLRGCTPHYKTTDSDGGCESLKELQLKTLKLSDPSFRADDFLKTSTDESEGTQSILLEAGDVLYHPAGVWHRVECLEDSVSINISLIATSYADVFAASISHLLMRHSSFRAPVRTLVGKSGDMEALERMREILNILPEICAGLTAEEILPPLTMEESMTNVQESKLEECEDDSSHSSNEESDGNDDSDEESAEVEEQDRVLYVCDVNYPEDFFPSEEKSKKTARVSTIRLRCNPLCTVITRSDIVSYEAAHNIEIKDDNVEYIVHSGHGSENFESINRVIVRLSHANSDQSDDGWDSKTEADAGAILNALVTFLRSQLRTASEKPDDPRTILTEWLTFEELASSIFSDTFSDNNSESKSRKRKRASKGPPSITLLKRIVYALYNAGAISILRD